ncbi:MAG: cyclic nucleotide-binding domain-containing protein [Proteobacteria bacterium]|nr:cyclic nucleotide-binding domain-containing protein [Pseudomonadota bacterium]
MPLNKMLKKSFGGYDQVVGDIWGGFAAMLVALPAAIAYGIAVYAVLGPQYVAYGSIAGIIGAIALGMIAPLLGGSPRLISAPCAPAAAVMGALAAEIIKTGNVSPENAVVVLIFVGLLAGMLELVYGALGGGRFIKYIPYPVVSGYLSGVGALIMLSQFPKLLGLPKGISVMSGMLTPSHWQGTGILVGVITIAGVLAAPRLVRAVPAVILGLFAGLLAYFGISIFIPELRTLADNRLVIGPLFQESGSFTTMLKGQWSAFSNVRMADIASLIMPAVTLSVLLSIDTLKTCVVMDTMTRSRHNSNRELMGQGSANIVSALLGGMPGSGTMGPTLVNIGSGGRTRLSGFLEGIFALIAFLMLAWFIAWLPIAALAGILMVVAWRMIDFRSVLLLRQRSTVLDFCVIALVVITAVYFNLIAAAGVGMGLAILLFIREQIRGSVIRRKIYGDQISSKQYRVQEEKELLQQYGNLITIAELQGSLFFGTTDQLFTEIEPDLKRSRFLILDMRRLQSVDFTAVHMLELFGDIMKEREGYLIFSHLLPTLPTGQNLEAYFNQLGLLKLGRNVKIFLTLDEAMQWSEDQILDEHRGVQTGKDQPLGLAEIELLREFENVDGLPFMKACVVELSFKAGETLFRRGDIGDELFIIRRGIVRIVLPLENDRYHILATFGRGNFFGEIAFLDRGARSADAVADTDTDVFVISRLQFDEVSRSNPTLGVMLFARIARGLALRLRYTDAELRALKEA